MGKLTEECHSFSVVDNLAGFSNRKSKLKKKKVEKFALLLLPIKVIFAHLLLLRGKF